MTVSCLKHNAGTMLFADEKS